MEMSFTLGDLINCGMLGVLVLMYKNKVDKHDEKLSNHENRIVRCETKLEIESN
jgi:hypothetical protein